MHIPSSANFKQGRIYFFKAWQADFKDGLPMGAFWGKLGHYELLSNRFVQHLPHLTHTKALSLLALVCVCLLIPQVEEKFWKQIESSIWRFLVSGLHRKPSSVSSVELKLLNLADNLANNLFSAPLPPASPPQKHTFRECN